MGRHKKPPRKCASETCDRTITTRSLCARCQKRKQRARNKQQNMGSNGTQSATSSSHAHHTQHAHAHSHAHSLAALAAGSVVASNVLSGTPAPLHHQRVLSQLPAPGLTQGFVLPISTSNALSSPSPPPLPSISPHIDTTKLQLEHDPQSIRSRQVPSDYKADKANVECDCCPTLEKAVVNGHVPCVRSIVTEHQANESILMDVESKNETIFHVLGRCATLHDRDYGDICAMLLKVPRDGRARLYMEFKNDEGQTPLFVASRFHECGSHEHTPTDALLVCSMFMQHGADPSIADNEGRVALHETTWQITHLLLQYDVDVNAQDKNGDTPLHRAALYLRANVAHELINQGQARQNITNHMGQTAREVVGTVLFESFSGTGLSMRDFEREQAITLQQFHPAPALHMGMSPIQHRAQPRMLHAHQTSLSQPSVTSTMLPSLTSPLSYSHHAHAHHQHPHHQHHSDLHHQADAHHHLAHLVQYAHHNPMGE